MVLSLMSSSSVFISKLYFALVPSEEKLTEVQVKIEESYVRLVGEDARFDTCAFVRCINQSTHLIDERFSMKCCLGQLS
jgi:hypothetical protein